MFDTRTRKIISHIRARKTRTGLVALSIFVAVLGIITMLTMGDLLVRQLEADLDEAKIAMVRVSVIPNPKGPVDSEALLTSLSVEPDVTHAEGQAVYSITWKKDQQEDFQTASLFAYSEPFEGISLEPMRLVDGTYPVAGRSEIAIERRFADKHGLSKGDSIVVQVLDGSNHTQENWTISGMVIFPYGYPGLNDILPEDSVFATFADAQHIAGFRGFSSIYVRYTSFDIAQARADELTTAIASEGSYIPILTVTENPAEHSRIRFARTIGGLMASVAVLTVLASGFVVFNVVTSIITEQKNQIGVLKTLGATRLDIVLIYAGIAFSYGLLGVIPGTVLGIPMGFFAAQGMAESSYTIIDGFGYSVRAIAIGTGLGLLIPVLASLNNST